MQNDPATVGASEAGHSDLVDVTLQDGKYTIRQVPGGRWECLRYGEPWPAFEGRQPDNLHTALAYEVDHLRQQVAGRLTAGSDSTLACDVEQLSDRVEGLSSDLDAAVEVAFRHGATEWVRLNYPTHFERLSVAVTTLQPHAAPILKGVGKIDGDGWKDVTRKGEVVFVWNRELPAPYASGQYPRIGKEHWSASTDQYDFTQATLDEIEALFSSPAEASTLESRESAPAGLAPAHGAEATAGTDAGGTAAFDDLLRAAQETVDFFEGTTDPELLPNEHVAIQKLRAAVSRAKGGPTVTEVFWSLYGALKEFADPLDTIADSLKKAPADHPSHGVATIRVKCSDCGKISKIIEVGVDPDTGFVGCEACESTEQLIMLKVGEV